jgi:tRNA pseudouridine38-40 synthase
LRNAHFALTVAYDGRPFHGWQVQADQPTVAGAILKAALPLFNGAPELVGASRTDAGVHACDQRARLSGVTRLDPHRLKAALNARLAASIRIYCCAEVGPEWGPKEGLFGKAYRYRIWCGDAAPPALASSCWVRPAADALDLTAMSAAARHLVGELDFDAFRSSRCQAPHARRAIWLVDVRTDDSHPDLPATDQAGQLIEIAVSGNAFCRHQVRIMVGTLVDVGRGRLEPAAIAAILAARDRSRAGITAPAEGLTLMRMLQVGDEKTSGLPSGWTWPGAPWLQSP